MATNSIAEKTAEDDNICQGDVFKNIRYIYIDEEDDDEVQIIEFTFPMALIISQACDVNAMGNIITQNSGKATKFMPSILMCPVYDATEAKSSNHLLQVFNELNIARSGEPVDNLFTKEDMNIASKDWHYRFHKLKVSFNEKVVVDDAIIDFKHYFTVPASYLIKNRQNRLFRLKGIYAEQITLKFATFLSRVAIP